MVEVWQEIALHEQVDFPTDYAEKRSVLLFILFSVKF